ARERLEAERRDAAKNREARLSAEEQERQCAFDALQEQLVAQKRQRLQRIHEEQVRKQAQKQVAEEEKQRAAALAAERNANYEEYVSVTTRIATAISAQLQDVDQEAELAAAEVSRRGEEEAKKIAADISTRNRRYVAAMENGSRNVEADAEWLCSEVADARALAASAAQAAKDIANHERVLEEQARQRFLQELEMIRVTAEEDALRLAEKLRVQELEEEERRVRGEQEAALRLQQACCSAAKASGNKQRLSSIKELKKHQSTAKRPEALVEEITSKADMESARSKELLSARRQAAQIAKQLEELRQEKAGAALAKQEQERARQLSQEAAARLAEACQTGEAATQGLIRLGGIPKRSNATVWKKIAAPKPMKPELLMPTAVYYHNASQELTPTEMQQRSLAARRHQEQIFTRIEYKNKMNKLAEEKAFREIYEPQIDPVQSAATGEAMRLAAAGNVNA
ncbi:MAG: hypothetical protein RRY35_07980, partial [Clostridiales bacterium]